MTALCGLDTCARPAPTATICEQHWWELDRALRSIPDLLAELDTSLARQSKTTPAGEKVTGKGETAVAFGLAASEAGAGLRDALTGWATTYVCPGYWWTTSLAARELLRVLPDSRARDDLAELCDEILDAHHRATRAVDAPAHRAIILLGGCPEPACNGQVRAFIPADTRPARMACDIGDGHHWGTEHWLRVGKRIRDRQVAA